MKQLTKIELEGMLPDYIFGKLSPEEIEIFEFNVDNFPDLVQDVKDAKELFSRIDATEFEHIISKKTRNTSVKVRNRMSRKKQVKFGKLQLFTRFVLPVAAVLAIFVYTIFVQQTNKDINTKPNLISEKIDSEEIRELISENEDFDILDMNFTTLTNEDAIYESQSDFIKQIYFDELLNNYDQILNYLNSKITYTSTKTLLLSSIDEDEFQDILKELENVGKIF